MVQRKDSFRAVVSRTKLLLVKRFLFIVVCCASTRQKSFCNASSFGSIPKRQEQQQEHRWQQHQQVAIDCDFNNDPCPSQFNRICEADDSVCPANTDCFDCDPCQQFRYDCQSCLQSGCYWCPGDAFCSSKPLEAPIWQRIEFLFHTRVTSSCPQADDWTTTTCQSQQDSTGNNNVYLDPLYDAMSWAYDLLQVQPVWKRGILGSGVRIRINDKGVDHLHSEFYGRFDIEGSCDHGYAARGGGGSISANHGTAVASLVGAAANNNHCAVGIAPNSTISSCYMELASDIHPDVLATIIESKISHMDISVNAWGSPTCLPKRPPTPRKLLSSTLAQSVSTCEFRMDHKFSPCHFCIFDQTNPDVPSSPGCLNAIIYYCSLRYEDDPDACNQYLEFFTSCQYSALTKAQVDALERGIDEGREGKGIIYVFAAGNSNILGSDTNFDGWVNTRYTISVGAVGKDGKHASYSTPGAALLVSGPGGDRESLTNNIVAIAGPGNRCGDVTVGTSFSAPYAAGVIALMLEVNPALTWRDVQGILALTSTQSDQEDESWIINGAGFHHSYKFGFGIANAEAAVNATERWELWGREEQVTVDSGVVNVPIADNPNMVSSSTVLINNDDMAAAGLFVESVVVKLDLLHASRGDLTIVLTSPEGTESILHPGKRPENTHLMDEERWELMTVRNWGESPIGNWSISLVDENLGILEDCLDLPFEYTWEDEDAKLVWTCTTLERVGACVRGTLLQSFADNLLTENRTAATNACCICGGGKPASSVSLLRSWQLVIYGHTLPPSPTPTDVPSAMPSPSPTSNHQTIEYDGPESFSLKSAAPVSVNLFSTLWVVSLSLLQIWRM